MTRRSGLVLFLVAAAVLAPGALVAYATPDGESAHATGIPGLPGFVGQKEENLKNVPGDPVKGLAVFRVFCSGCHNFKSSGLQAANKPGSDLDDRKPTYDKIVTLIAQGGGGGAFSRELLQDLTFDQIYDVAKYVAVYAGRPGPVKGASLEPPVPVELAAPLLDAQSDVKGHFTATLSGNALRWRIHVGNGANQPSHGRIRLGRQGGTLVTPITLDCVRCFDEGAGFALLTSAAGRGRGERQGDGRRPRREHPERHDRRLRGTIAAQS